MTSVEENDEKNEMLVMVLTDLAGICKNLAETSALPETLRVKAREFGEGFDSLSPVRSEGTAHKHAQGEHMLIKIARFQSSVLEVQAAPATVSKQ